MCFFVDRIYCCKTASAYRACVIVFLTVSNSGILQTKKSLGWRDSWYGEHLLLLTNAQIDPRGGGGALDFKKGPGHEAVLFGAVLLHNRREAGGAADGVRELRGDQVDTGGHLAPLMEVCQFGCWYVHCIYLIWVGCKVSRRRQELRGERLIWIGMPEWLQ